MCYRCGCEQHHHKEGQEDESRLEHTRRFLTRAEKVEIMRGYAEELRKELAAVEEQISELESQG